MGGGGEGGLYIEYFLLLCVSVETMDSFFTRHCNVIIRGHEFFLHIIRVSGGHVNAIRIILMRLEEIA